MSVCVCVCVCVRLCTGDGGLSEAQDTTDFRVQGSRFWIQGLALRVLGLAFGVEGAGSRARGSEFSV